MAEVWRTGAVAKIKSNHRQYDIDAVEYYYAIQTPKNFQKENLKADNSNPSPDSAEQVLQ